MSHVSEGGINLKVQTTAHTKFGTSIVNTTEDVYNTFDDLLLYVLETLEFETVAELLANDVTLHRGVNTIVNEMSADCAFSYKLVH